MPIKIQRAEEVVSSSLARWGIYGANGVGKTTFVSTIPPDIPTLVVSADEENVKPLVGKGHIRVVKVSRWTDIGDIYAYLRDKISAHENGKKFFKCIVFDTWTRMQGLALNHVVGYDVEMPTNVQELISRIPRTARGYDVWHQVGLLASEWARYFVRLPIHTVFLFQETIRQPQSELGVVTIEPALTPSALAAVKDALELIGRMYVATSGESGLAEDLRSVDPDATERRYLFLGKHERIFAKGPTHILGRVVEEPTWSKLAACLVGKTEESSKKEE